MGTMNKIINTRAPIILAFMLSVAFSLKAVAGNQTTPYSNLNIIALEIIEPENILRLFVKRRIRIDAPPFDFNPANCEALGKALSINGKNLYSQEEEPMQSFDIPLGVKNRSAIEQRQLINEVFAAFVSSRTVSLVVNNETCSSMGGRQVTGIRVN